jgi:hypothetical protein
MRAEPGSAAQDATDEELEYALADEHVVISSGQKVTKTLLLRARTVVLHLPNNGILYHEWVYDCPELLTCMKNVDVLQVFVRFGTGAMKFFKDADLSNLKGLYVMDAWTGRTEYYTYRTNRYLTDKDLQTDEYKQESNPHTTNLECVFAGNKPPRNLVVLGIWSAYQMVVSAGLGVLPNFQRRSFPRNLRAFLISNLCDGLDGAPSDPFLGYAHIQLIQITGDVTASLALAKYVKDTKSIREVITNGSCTDWGDKNIELQKLMVGSLIKRGRLQSLRIQKYSIISAQTEEERIGPVTSKAWKDGATSKDGRSSRLRIGKLTSFGQACWHAFNPMAEQGDLETITWYLDREADPTIDFHEHMGLIK